MGRNKRSPLLIVLTIGALMVGIILCVAGGRMVAGKMTSGARPFSHPAQPSPVSQETATPPLSTGRSGADGTKTSPGAHGSTPPLATEAPPSKPASPATVDPSQAAPPTTRTSEPAGSSPQPPGESPTATSTHSHTPLPSRPATGSPTATPDSSPPTSAPTATPLVVTPRTRTPGSVTGRVVRDGELAETGVTVKLEDQAYDIVATATTDAQGTYTFESVTPSSLGFNVLFAQEWNEQYEENEVVSWAWLGPFTVESDATVELPDLEISLFDFEQTAPPSGASFSSSEISPASPLTFEWAPYPGASAYWVDLSQGEEGGEGEDLDRVWQSTLLDSTSASFDGELTEGSHIAADIFYWGVGALKDVGDYQLTVYGYLPTLEITP